MASTTIIPLHVGKGRPVAKAIGRTTDYVKNPDKTDGGEWVTSFECDPLIVDKEFLYSKRRYAAITGRDQGERDVIGYHLRISFKPGETDAQTANRIGYDLAMKLTRGSHAFICCTHVDKAHVHTHVVINSTNLDCTRKFRNFKGSAFAIRRIADLLCLENGLSVIQKPKPSRGSYGKWQGDEKRPTIRDSLRGLIDENLVIGRSFGEFLASLKAAGCEIRLGKHISIRLPDGKRNIRLDSLGDDYSEAAIKQRLAGTRDFVRNKKTEGGSKQEAVGISVAVSKDYRPNLLIDIQAKIREGAGDGYARWMRIFNLKQAARTLMFLQENGIDSYDDLCTKAAAASAEYNGRNNRIKEIESRQKEINDLQAQIGTYGKTRDVYAAYRESEWSDIFFEAHRAEITLHRAAKKFFDGLGFGKDKKLPTINALRQEWAALEAEKKKLYVGLKQIRDNHTTLGTAKANADILLNSPQQRQSRRDLDAR